ncbi:MAG: LuxR C-terminal-related transcriptional regulator [Thermoleophilia bacterium]|nr:LuxR C-terminal-related transcriptional regulator [Thermoleophilia bacterium]
MGLTNREVGERLFISERTVARHVARVFARLGVSTRTAAVHVARERGLITDGDLSGAGAGRVAGIAPGHAALGAPPT